MRFRALILAAVAEKASFSVATIVLFLRARVAAPVLAVGLVDLTLGILFAAPWLRLRERKHE